MFGSVIPGTYQGFMGALARWTDTLMGILWPVLHQRMQEIGGKFWRIGKWVPIAFDGSRSTAPRSEANEAAFCAKNYGKGNTAKYRKKKTKGIRRRKNDRSTEGAKDDGPREGAGQEDRGQIGRLKILHGVAARGGRWPRFNKRWR